MDIAGWSYLSTSVAVGGGMLYGLVKSARSRDLPPEPPITTPTDYVGLV